MSCEQKNDLTFFWRFCNNIPEEKPPLSAVRERERDVLPYWLVAFISDSSSSL